MPGLLVCPTCGADVEVDMGYEGRAYMQENTLRGFECENYSCLARWDRHGNPERESQLLSPREG